MPFSQWGAREACLCVFTCVRVCVRPCACMHGCLWGVNCGVCKWRNSWSPITVVRPPEGRTLEDSLCKDHSTLVRLERGRAPRCSCALCPVWGSRDTALCASMEAWRWLTHAAALTHTYIYIYKRSMRTHMCTLRVGHARQRCRLERRKKKKISCHRGHRHSRVTGVTMVSVWGGGVDGRSVGIVINLCLVWKEVISFHKGCWWDGKDRFSVCGWLMIKFCRKNGNKVRKGLRQENVGRKRSLSPNHA